MDDPHDVPRHVPDGGSPSFVRSQLPIEIVGGGLAGLALGTALVRRGVPVTILERDRYPRHRVCGEFITGLSKSTIAALQLAPVLDDALRLDELTWHRGGKMVRRQRLPQPALGVSRHRLDARLAEAFRRAGGTLRENSRVVEKNDAPGRVYSVGRRAADSGWIGLKFHARQLRDFRNLELHLGREAYAGLSEIEDGRANICGLFRRRGIQEKGPRLLLAYLRACGLGALADRLEAADIDPHSCCAIAGVQFDAGVRNADRLELGDTSGVIPPFTGHGMAMAFESAAVALIPITRYAGRIDSWAETSGAIRSALTQKFRVRLACAAALHPFFWRPNRQAWLAMLARSRLLPLKPLYAILH